MEQHTLTPVQSHNTFETDNMVVTMILKGMKTEVINHPTYGKVKVVVGLKQDYLMTGLN